MPYRNPINNMIVPIGPRDLKVCNRCGCKDLAWVKYKSGKWGLVQTSTRRPFWRGDSPAPEGLWAVKTAFHNCQEYQNQVAQHAAEMVQYQAAYDDKIKRADWCHPKADKPIDIIADAVVYLYTNYPAESCDVSSSIFAAVRIMSLAATQVSSKV